MYPNWQNWGQNMGGMGTNTTQAQYMGAYGSQMYPGWNYGQQQWAGMPTTSVATPVATSTPAPPLPSQPEPTTPAPPLPPPEKPQPPPPEPSQPQPPLPDGDSENTPPVNPAPPVEPPTEEKPPLPPEPPPEESTDTKTPGLAPKNEHEQEKMSALQIQAQQWQQQQQQWAKYQEDWAKYQQQMQEWQKQNQHQVQSQAMAVIVREEEEFNEQYSTWLKQFEDWKEQNKNHPNQEQFQQYEAQWKEYEKQMEDKRKDIAERKAKIVAEDSKPANQTGVSSGAGDPNMMNQWGFMRQGPCGQWNQNFYNYGGPPRPPRFPGAPGMFPMRPPRPRFDGPWGPRFGFRGPPGVIENQRFGHSEGEKYPNQFGENNKDKTDDVSMDLSNDDQIHGHGHGSSFRGPEGNGSQSGETGGREFVFEGEGTDVNQEQDQGQEHEGYRGRGRGARGRGRGFGIGRGVNNLEGEGEEFGPPGFRGRGHIFRGRGRGFPPAYRDESEGNFEDAENMYNTGGFQERGRGFRSRGRGFGPPRDHGRDMDEAEDQGYPGFPGRGRGNRGRGRGGDIYHPFGENMGPEMECNIEGSFQGQYFRGRGRGFAAMSEETGEYMEENEELSGPGQRGRGFSMLGRGRGFGRGHSDMQEKSEEQGEEHSDFGRGFGPPEHGHGRGAIDMEMSHRGRGKGFPAGRGRGFHLDFPGQEYEDAETTEEDYPEYSDRGRGRGFMARGRGFPPGRGFPDERGRGRGFGGFGRGASPFEDEEGEDHIGGRFEQRGRGNPFHRGFPRGRGRGGPVSLLDLDLSHMQKPNTTIGEEPEEEHAVNEEQEGEMPEWTGGNMGRGRGGPQGHNLGPNNMSAPRGQGRGTFPEHGSESRPTQEDHEEHNQNSAPGPKLLSEREHDIIRKAAEELKMIREQQTKSDPPDSSAETPFTGGDQPDQAGQEWPHEAQEQYEDFSVQDPYMSQQDEWHPQDEARFPQNEPFNPGPPSRRGRFRPGDQYPPGERTPYGYSDDNIIEDPHRWDPVNLPPLPGRGAFPERDPYMDSFHSRDSHHDKPPPSRVERGHGIPTGTKPLVKPAAVIDYGHGKSDGNNGKDVEHEHTEYERDREMRRGRTGPSGPWQREEEGFGREFPHDQEHEWDPERGHAPEYDSRMRGRVLGYQRERENIWHEHELPKAYHDEHRERDYDREREHTRDRSWDWRERERDIGRERNRERFREFMPENFRDEYPDRERERGGRGFDYHGNGPPPGHFRDSPQNDHRDPFFHPDLTDSPIVEKIETVMVDDILVKPGRKSRPDHIVVIIRGLPGAGKTHVAKLLKDKEVANGGSTPRMLCLDDYFMNEVEKYVVDSVSGKKIKKQVLEYDYEPEMEESYRQSLLKSFSKQIDNLYFNFLILDAINDKIAHFEEFWSYAKSKGFQVYIAEVQADVNLCAKRNSHGKSLEDIEEINKGWEPLPNHFMRLDIRSLLQDDAITDVVMEDDTGETAERKGEGDSDSQDSQDDDDKGGHQKSRWELEASEEVLDKLDGIRIGKRKRESSPQRMEDYLQLPDDYDTRLSQPGKKRVRWADIESRKDQVRRRELGFIVGQTDWASMTDDDYAERALNRTKYF